MGLSFVTHVILTYLTCRSDAERLGQHRAVKVHQNNNKPLLPSTEEKRRVFIISQARALRHDVNNQGLVQTYSMGSYGSYIGEGKPGLPASSISVKNVTVTDFEIVKFNLNVFKGQITSLSQVNM